MAVGQASLGLGRTIFANSGAVTASSSTPNLRLSPTLYDYIPASEAVDILLNVTANTGVASSVNPQWVQLEMSPDGGSTWIPFWRSANITTSTYQSRTSMRVNGIGANEAAASTAAVQTQTAAVTQNCCITQDQRVVWTQSTSLGNSPSLTFGLYAVLQTAGSRSSY